MRFLREGLRQRPATRRPGSTRSKVKRTRAASDNVSLKVAPLPERNLRLVAENAEIAGATSARPIGGLIGGVIRGVLGGMTDGVAVNCA